MHAYKLPSNGKAITDLAVVGKSRKPRFELHLKIYDLNNVPLVSGASTVKWFLPHSIRGEHRDRTRKRPIINHRVEYNYSKIVPVRLVIDRRNRLTDCPIEFEVTQEFENHGGGRHDEKIILGKVTLNLAEYVVESEALLREGRNSTSSTRGSALAGLDLGLKESPVSGSPGPGTGTGTGTWHGRQRSSLSTKGTFTSHLSTSPGSVDTGGSSGGGGGGGVAESVAESSNASINAPDAPPVEDGVVRRYLMQDSRINSTLKIGILMVQVDGERTFVAPPLKSASMFGAIAGVMANRDVVGDGLGADERDECGLATGALGRVRDTTEIQDVYRRALAASWACQSGELPADECIEDIFRGGDGFRPSDASSHSIAHPNATRLPHAGGGGGGGGGASRARATALPAGGTLGAVLEGDSGWSPASPTPSTLDEEDSPGSSVSQQHQAHKGAGAGAARMASRILPRLGPIRRKTLPAHLRLGKEGHDGAAAATGAAGAAGTEHSEPTTSSGEEETSAGERHATLRPRDFQKLRRPPTSSSSSSSLPALAGLHLHGREDSSVSDRTATPPRPDSSRSSPGPQSPAVSAAAAAAAAAVPLRRDDSHGSLGSHGSHGSYGSGLGVAALRPGSSRSSDSRRVASGGGGRRPGSASGSGSGSGPGSAHAERRRRVPEVNEHEVRDDFVAWQLPGTVTASP